LYESLCREYRPIGDVNYCVNLLKTDPRIPLAKTYHELSKYILQMAIDKATSIQDYLIIMAKKFPNDKAVGNCVLPYYDNCIMSFHTALDEVEGEEPKSALTDAEAACNEIKNCDKAMQNDKPSFDPIAINVRNNETFFLSVMSVLAIIHLK
jgi:pectinesterase inhibitor-like protein